MLVHHNKCAFRTWHMHKNIEIVVTSWEAENSCGAKQLQADDVSLCESKTCILSEARLQACVKQIRREEQYKQHTCPIPIHLSDNLAMFLNNSANKLV